ncbi:MAG: ribonuclease HI [Burkholderiales bacterium]|nr:ribonuclease HI [Bacteroidia bacterium]
MKSKALIYTDGSCHTQLCVGAWAAIILVDDKKITLSGKEFDTTHNRMEILAVIHSILHVKNNFNETKSIHIVSDSQYVVGLMGRRSKFIAGKFQTKSGNDIRNKDLVKEFFDLVSVMDVRFEKIKAHQKATEVINYNIEADKICRQLVRESVKERM